MGSTELIDSKVDKMAELLKFGIDTNQIDEANLEVTDHFAKGVYARELFIPKGTVIVGKIHRYKCINIMLRGDITVYSNGESKRIDKPFISVSEAGEQKAAYANEDTVWINIHATDSTDVDEIESDVIAPSRDDKLLLNEVRKIKRSS